MNKYRIWNCGYSYIVQKWGLVMLDGCPDYMWKNIARFDTEEEAQNYIDKEERNA